MLPGDAGTAGCFPGLRFPGGFNKKMNPRCTQRRGAGGKEMSSRQDHLVWIQFIPAVHTDLPRVQRCATSLAEGKGCVPAREPHGQGSNARKHTLAREKRKDWVPKEVGRWGPRTPKSQDTEAAATHRVVTLDAAAGWLTGPQRTQKILPTSAHASQCPRGPRVSVGTEPLRTSPRRYKRKKGTGNAPEEVKLNRRGLSGVGLWVLSACPVFGFSHWFDSECVRLLFP